MAESSSRRGALIGLGTFVLLAGLVAAVVLWNVASTRRSNAISDLARAPVGCDTTLDFVETGEYFVFLERSGTIDGVRGDCEVEGSFDLTGSRLPDVDVVIFDPDGNEIDLDRASKDVTYDDGEFSGEAIQTVDIAERNDHVVRVESTDDDAFVIAIGRDPADGVAAIRGGALVAAAAGLIIGLGLILLGARKAKATVAAGSWAPAQPTGGFPPGGVAPQGPPSYGQPGQPHYPQPPYQQPGPYQQAPPQPAPYQQPGPYQQAPPQPAPYQQAPPLQAPGAASQPGPYQQAPGAAPPHAPYQQPGQQVPPGAPPQQVPYQQVPQQPPSPFAPTPPHAPTDPAGRAQPIEWAPSGETRPNTTPDDFDTGPPDAEFIARLQAERDQQPPPPS